ncbi:uncharacterized protein LOC120154968 [Hibiscus syriacus]|uniref:uncharacterized protein LOC120154968 n=1 Tax=Hibiscus syriacus TaxID=106335 RepID=UPI0019212455|nr:uncharacterized protein LOC120154968 [Hibiscus syriacus]
MAPVRREISKNKSLVLARSHHKSQSVNKCKRNKLAVGKKLYKSSIQRAKEIVRIKRRESGLAKMIEEKRMMTESLRATQRDAAEAEERLRLMERRRDEMIGIAILFMLIGVLDSLLMFMLGFY